MAKCGAEATIPFPVPFLFPACIHSFSYVPTVTPDGRRHTDKHIHTREQSARTHLSPSPTEVRLPKPRLVGRSSDGEEPLRSLTLSLSLSASRKPSRSRDRSRVSVSAATEETSEANPPVLGAAVPGPPRSRSEAVASTPAKPLPPSTHKTNGNEVTQGILVTTSCSW